VQRNIRKDMAVIVVRIPLVRVSHKACEVHKAVAENPHLQQLCLFVSPCLCAAVRCKASVQTLSYGLPTQDFRTTQACGSFIEHFFSGVIQRACRVSLHLRRMTPEICRMLVSNGRLQVLDVQFNASSDGRATARAVANIMEFNPKLCDLHIQIRGNAALEYLDNGYIDALHASNRPLRLHLDSICSGCCALHLANNLQVCGVLSSWKGACIESNSDVKALATVLDASSNLAMLQVSWFASVNFAYADFLHSSYDIFPRLAQSASLRKLELRTSRVRNQPFLYRSPPYDRFMRELEQSSFLYSLESGYSDNGERWVQHRLLDGVCAKLKNNVLCEKSRLALAATASLSGLTAVSWFGCCDLRFRILEFLFPIQRACSWPPADWLYGTFSNNIRRQES